MDIFIEEIIFFDLTHYFIDVEAENEKEAQIAALDEHKLENLNFRQRVWVSRVLVFFFLKTISDSMQPSISFAGAKCSSEI